MLTIAGTIQGGKKRGRRLGFPTINISVPRSVAAADWGIYFSLTRIDGLWYPGVTHLGPPKTFSIRNATCETYLLTLTGDLYGKKITKKLIFKLREVERFPTVAALKQRIKKDVIAAKKFFGLK